MKPPTTEQVQKAKERLAELYVVRTRLAKEKAAEVTQWQRLDNAADEDALRGNSSAELEELADDRLHKVKNLTRELRNTCNEILRMKEWLS